MTDRILVPLDGSLPATAALTVGNELAARLDAELHVLALIEKGRDATAVHDLIRRQVSRIDGEPTVDIRSLVYGVPDDIAAEFDSTEDTLLVMQTWARGRSAGVVGNISEEVMRLIRKPMVVVGPNSRVTDWPTGPMFIATDGSPHGDGIAEQAATLGLALGLTPELVTVVDPSKVPAGVSIAAESNSIAGLAGSVGASTGSVINYDVLHGPDPATVIVDHADHRGASLVAMSTHGRSGIARLAEDSVAMDVVRYIDCPVMLYRPPADEH